MVQKYIPVILHSVNCRHSLIEISIIIYKHVRVPI